MNIDLFIDEGFNLIEEYNYDTLDKSYVFSYLDSIIIVDDHFDKKEEIFDYNLYCNMQNRYMKITDKLLRFNLLGDELELIQEIKRMINLEVNEIEASDRGGFLDKAHIDNSPAEQKFEEIFSDCYGMDAFEYLQREAQISIGDNKTASVDFLLETKSGNYTFEANGITYHHPQITGKEDYEHQLNKQNYLVLMGFKVYRFSSNNLQFKDQVIENLKDLVVNKDEFIPNAIIKQERQFKLYEHQEDILKLLDEDRKNGKDTALIVIPMGAGKSQIVLEDLKKDYIKKEVKNVLILTPTVKIRGDWETRTKGMNYNFDILCYNTAFVRKNDLDPTYYDYIVFDEAHHALAANCKKTVQYYKPKYLIGLTATDKDKAKLSEIFGTYEVNMSLKEAIEKGVVVDVACYRLMSNINLENIRYNGKDYNNADLERTVIVDSRNELIAKVIKEYFSPKENYFKQGIVFCVNKQHTIKVAKVLNDYGITARAVYGGNSKNDESFELYQNKKIQFLCSCQLISEGWDSPQTEVVVMARPTLSRVLYLQQIGRGLRHYEGKECMYLIDVVDNYNAKLTPFCFHSIMHNPNYIPWGGVRQSGPYVEILGLSESEISMQLVDIFTFEEQYGDYLSLEQAARELYIGTNTLSKWNKDKKYASLYLPIGNKQMPYFSQDDIDKIRLDKGLKQHNDETILEDFKDFIKENQLTFSFKLIFLLSAFKLANKEGEINLTDLVNNYSKFYQNRINKGLPVDRQNCIYDLEYLSDISKIKKSLLENPFEKFERKRFVYLSKDLNIICFNPKLWEQLDKDTINELINFELEKLEEYYQDLGGLDKEYKI